MSAAGKTLLVRNVELLATMDDARRELRNAGLFARGNAIEWVGPMDEAPATADTEIDLSQHLLLPGLVNTHHHMYQSLTRAVPGAQDAELFGWLKRLYPVWLRLTPEMVTTAAELAIAELMLSGCTTSSDHHYVFPDGVQLHDTIIAAQTLGLRFHATRGAMSLGESEGGLPPDALVEDESAILRDMQRVIELWHDAAPRSMLRIGLAPCSPFSVTPDLMRETAALARAYRVGLHTHLAESDNDVAYSRERFRRTPAEYAEEMGWVGPDVWHAHCVKLDDAGIALFGRTRTGVAHCPCSNMRLASGIAPVQRLRRAGAAVGLGVDGSASNDCGHLLLEARQAMLLARVGGGPAAMSAREALALATVGGAAALGRNDIGALAPGMAADFIAFDLRAIEFAGALHDPLAALVFCAPARPALSVINGRIVIREGTLLTRDRGALVERHNRLALRLLEGSS